MVKQHLPTTKDDETDMKSLEETMRAIEMEGLQWGASKLVPLAFGIKKLQVNLVVEDEKVSIDDLQAKIEEDEEHVQSTDVVSQSLASYMKIPGLMINSPLRLPCRSYRLLPSYGPDGI